MVEGSGGPRWSPDQIMLCIKLIPRVRNGTTIRAHLRYPNNHTWPFSNSSPTRDTQAVFALVEGFKQTAALNNWKIRIEGSLWTLDKNKR